ncbi:MAG: hypothetical protein ABJB11_13660 [Ferruginibacter sp.]
MTYALETIQTLVHVELNPAFLQLQKPGDDLVTNAITKIIAEEAKIRSTLTQEIFRFTEENAAAYVIQQYQLSIINLLDDVSEYDKSIDTLLQHAPAAAASVIRVYTHLDKSLRSLLAFLEKNFRRYFNLDERIPGSYKLMMQAEFRVAVKSLIKKYKALELPPDFIQMMLHPFQKFINSERLTTYRELLYLKTLHEKLKGLIPYSIKATEQTIIDELFFLNYNHHSFVSYYLSKISAQIKQATDANEQLGLLAWWLKSVSQAGMQPTVAYKLKQPSVKEQAIGWLADEMNFLEKKQQLAFYLQPQTGDAAKPPFNLLTALSVKQVALLIRILFDTGMIKSANQTEMLNNMATVLKTERKEIISPQNLRAKYYNIDEPTKNILKEWLFKMNDQLRKY